MEKIKAKGSITWIDDELVGFKCACGGKEMSVSIYEDGAYSCEGCGKKYVLKQENTVYEIV